MNLYSYQHVWVKFHLKNQRIYYYLLLLLFWNVTQTCVSEMFVVKGCSVLTWTAHSAGSSMFSDTAVMWRCRWRGRRWRSERAPLIRLFLCVHLLLDLLQHFLHSSQLQRRKQQTIKHTIQAKLINQYWPINESHNVDFQTNQSY